MTFRCLLALALAGAYGMGSASHAADPLRLPEAVARALASNPALAAEAERLEARRARARLEALPPDARLGVDVENFAGSGTLEAFGGAETTLRLGRVIELGGKRAAREALGSAEVAQQAHQFEQVRIEVASRTAQRFIETLADQERLAQARERVAMAERSRREVAVWVAAARNPDTDLLAAELAVSEAELELEHAEHELESARVSLAASWGVTRADFDVVEGDLHAVPALEPFAALAQRLPESSTQRAAILDAEVLTARRRSADASAAPDLDVSLGVRRIEGLDDQGLVMSVALPLGKRRRATLATSEIEAQLAAVEARREADRVESHQALFEQYQEMRHALTELDALREAMLPKAEKAVASARRGFEAGRFSFQVLAQAQNTLFALRQRGVEAATRFHLLQIEVDRLTARTEDTTP